MYERVLVPTDGSAGTERTLDHALAIAGDAGATVHGLYVTNRRLYIAAAKERQPELRAELEAEGRRAVGVVERRAAEAGIDVVTDVLDGIPHRAIVEYADEHGIDLVVMGTHGKTGRDRLESLGSVTERVVESASVPVLTVPIGDDG